MTAMEPRPDAGTGEQDDGARRMTTTFAAVLALEALVLLALWAAGRYFGPA
jgi:hypothetical protein